MAEETNPFADMFAAAATKAAETMAADQEIPVTFDMAKALTTAGNYDAAIEAWTALLEAAVEAHGETGDETAALYYRYGDALLRKCEESDQIFGGDGDGDGDDGVEEEAAAPPPPGGNSLAAASSLDDDDEAAEAPAAAEDLAGDVEGAFEVLEVSRTIYDRLGDGAGAKQGLGDCWLRLGDLNKLNGRFEAAVSDYRACLALRAALDGPESRETADVHWCLAFALECRAADKDCDAPRTLRDEAIDHYVACEAALTAVVAKLDDAAKIKDVKEVLDELAETIADARARKAQELARAASGEPAAPAATTTIGFARPANQAVADAPVVTLQPKRKKQKVDVAGVENTN